MPWLPEARKDAAGRESLRGGASGLRSAGVRMGQPAARGRGITLLGEANPTNRNIPVVGGEENKSDPPSSGERKGASPNAGDEGRSGRSGRRLERRAGAGDSPVRVTFANLAGTLSRAGSEEPCPNPAAPSAKAKHSRETDSARVP